MSELNENVRDAFNKGYRINEKGMVISPFGKQLYCTTSCSGYKRFTIRNSSGCRVTVLVHKLMAYQKFDNALFSDGVVVRHLDGNPSNNTPDNILIGSLSDNSRDIPEDLRIKNAKYASSFIIKHDAVKIKNDWNQGLSYSQIMRKYDISSKGTVSYIINSR
jgi:hypothetical protein